MIREFFFILLFGSFPILLFAQFGADYSSYGFNFVNDTYNDGLSGWTGTHITTPNTAKINIYQQSALNNYALELKAQNDSVKVEYNDSGYMDLNPCSFVINIRLNIPQFTGNQDGFALTVYTGSKLVIFQILNTGIYYVDNNYTYTYVTAAPTPNQWQTYTISLDNCSSTGQLMIENDDINTFSLNFPNNTNSQLIQMYTVTNGVTVFETEVDHLMIYSNPTKWWLGPSTAYIDENNYVGTTGDRQHYLNLPNGERIGVNENGGGFVTFTELYSGGPNLDPNPKFGSGGTKTLRNYFHSSDYNPVQPGTSSVTGGHLATVTTTSDEITISPYPLHLYYKSGITENNPLTFPSGETMTDFDNSTVDNDVYDEFGLDMRHEIITELDFSSTLTDVSQSGGISVVRHRGEWAYIRHPCQVLQYHEPDANPRYQLNGAYHSDSDMGEMRHKFEFRLNKDLGYKWVLWRDGGAWQTLELTSIGDKQTYTSFTVSSIPLENRFMIFSTSNSLTDPNAVAWYYPESNYNANCTVQKSRTDKSEQSSTDRRFKMQIISDWRKSNWCRMNLYIFNKGLYAPNHDNVNTYEAFQMEAYQLFGTPNDIWSTIQTISLPVELSAFEVEQNSKNEVSITWETSTEVNNDYFTVERSTNGISWEELERVEGAGNSVEPLSYSTLDLSPYLGISFYRLKQTDFNGQYSYSEIRSISNSMESDILVIYPNPSKGIVSIDLNGLSIERWKLVDSRGKDYSKNIRLISKSDFILKFDLSNLSTGNYFFILNNSIIRKIQKCN